MRKISVHLDGVVIPVVAGVTEAVDSRQSSTSGRFSMYNMDSGVLRRQAPGNLAGPIRTLIIDHEDLDIRNAERQDLGH